MSSRGWEATRAVEVLGIPVDTDLRDRWSRWFAPAEQPFFVDDASAWPSRSQSGALTAELRDTFKVWRMPDPGEIVWLDERAFLALPRPQRASLVREQANRRRGAVPTVGAWQTLLDPATLRSQADGHRFVWWPSLLDGHRDKILTASIEAGERSSRHAEVPASTWSRCEPVLPGAHELAGTFAPASGPNCFGTVMAAAGVANAANEWVLQDRFEEWLHECCVPGGQDQDPGTALVWRTTEHLPVHAAVTLGDGWAIEKPAQTWWTPRTVLAVRELIAANRSPGQRLERHRLIPK